MAMHGYKLIQKYFQCTSSQTFVQKMTVINECNEWEKMLKDFKFKEDGNNQENGQQQISNENVIYL